MHKQRQSKGLGRENPKSIKTKVAQSVLGELFSPSIRQLKMKMNTGLTAIITLPDALNCSPAMSISTIVSAPTAGCETQARK